MPILPSWLLRPRPWFVAIFLGCAALLAFGSYLQHVKGLEPCPMCILQRYAFLAACGIALVAALHNPAKLGVAIYAAAVAVAALAGGGVAVWQSWLQHHPPAVADCGPGLDYMVESFPLSEALPMIFRGSGDCSKVDWTFLGLSIAECAILAFAGILVACVVAVLTARRVGPTFR